MKYMKIVTMRNLYNSNTTICYEKYRLQNKNYYSDNVYKKYWSKHFYCKFSQIDLLQ